MLDTVVLVFAMALGFIAESVLLSGSSIILIVIFAGSCWMASFVWAATVASNHNFEVTENKRQAEF